VALLDGSDEELVDWGDDSPDHTFAKMQGGEDAEHPRRGASPPTPTAPLPELAAVEAPGGSVATNGDSGESAAGASEEPSSRKLLRVLLEQRRPS
jgi:hypothetical protein